jgi:hypothetical protein
VLAWPEHAIGMVGHLFEGHRPEAVGRFGVHGAWLGAGKPGQEPTHQIGQGPEYLGVPVVAWQRGRDGG